MVTMAMGPRDTRQHQPLLQYWLISDVSPGGGVAVLHICHTHCGIGHSVIYTLITVQWHAELAPFLGALNCSEC